ncbi:STAS domain-containing protein [Aestuariivita boseongensis]|uniref:STAS domain-containing protein n=1 Tax=Aestuariivita boseongensis TaxID=1470562 RepID=UPI0012FAFAE1|nr:STAS domain-containing protein [Aestuariivita boseongensis]
MTAPKTDPIDLSLPIWRDDPKQLQTALLEQVADGICVKADLPRPADTLTVQLILAARRAAEDASKPFVVVEPSEAFRDGLQTLGIHDDILG